MLKRFRSLSGKSMMNGILLFGTALLFVLLNGCGDNQTTREELRDEDISYAIQSELVIDNSVPADEIGVNVEEGVAILSSTVDNILAKRKALELAETIRGVRSVVNNIQVLPIEVSDDQIKHNVETLLLGDPVTDSYDIEVAVNDGIADLKGEVDSWHERELASEIAMGVIGIREINNELVVDYKEERIDAEIKEDIKSRLANDPWVDEYLISVSVNDGNVKLDGTVGSVAEKRYAMSDSWVVGTNSVDAEELEVNAWANEDLKRSDRYYRESDEEIKAAVMDAFYYDPRVAAFDIDVSVENGSATLSGTVDNLQAKMSAEKDAQNTLGVWEVENNINVEPQNVPRDSELKQRVKEALQRDPYVQFFDLNVRAESGIVYLSGDVNTKFEKEQAEHIAWKTKGVIEVINNIEYDYTAADKSDDELKEDVQDHLYWSPFVNHNDVQVSVENGVVELTGEVYFRSEKEAAEENAYEAGAKDVINNIEAQTLY